MSSKLEPTIWSGDTDQRISCFDTCQLTTTWMSNIKDVPAKNAAYTTEFHLGIHGGVDGRMVVWSYVAKMKFSRTGGVPYFLTYGAQRARLRLLYVLKQKKPGDIV